MTLADENQRELEDLTELSNIQYSAKPAARTTLPEVIGLSFYASMLARNELAMAAGRVAGKPLSRNPKISDKGLQEFLNYIFEEQIRFEGSENGKDEKSRQHGYVVTEVENPKVEVLSILLHEETSHETHYNIRIQDPSLFVRIEYSAQLLRKYGARMRMGKPPTFDEPESSQ